MTVEGRTKPMRELIEWLEDRMSPNTPVTAGAVSSLVSNNPSFFSNLKTRQKKVPGPQILARFVRALHSSLLDVNHPLADSTTVPRAFVVAGFMTDEDLALERDSGAVLDLVALSGEGQEAMRRFYEFQLANEQGEGN